MGKRKLYYLGVVGVVAAMAMSGHAAEPAAGGPGVPLPGSGDVCTAAALPVLPDGMPMAARPGMESTVVPRASMTGIPRLAPSVKIVLGLDPEKMHFGVRVLAASQLSKSLPQETQALLFEFLARTAVPGVSEDELNALKNDILNALIAQTVPVPDFSQRLIDMYHADSKTGSAPPGHANLPIGETGVSPANLSPAPETASSTTTASPGSAGGSPASISAESRSGAPSPGPTGVRPTTGVPPVGVHTSVCANATQPAAVPASASQPTSFPSPNAARSGDGAPNLLPRQNPAWRDYCIQFLGIRYGQIGDVAERKMIWRVLNEALCDREGAIAATALLALYRNLNADPGLTKETVAGALYLLRQDYPSTAVRMTALQVGAELCAAQRTGVTVGQCDGVTVKTETGTGVLECGDKCSRSPLSNQSGALGLAGSSLVTRHSSLENTPVLPDDPRPAVRVELLTLARKLATNTQTTTVLRISAVAAIGTLGDASDRPMLDDMAKDNASRLQIAAETARKKIAMQTATR